MNRGEFLEGLRNALSGEVPPAVVQENLRYYDEYIRTEIQKGRKEADVMEELGDARLIARTIIDTTPGAGDGGYEAYNGSAGRYQEERRQQEQTSSRGSGIHYYDLNKWYWKLLGILLVVGILFLVLTVVGGLLSLVIPMLPVIGLLMVIMWFVRGPRR